MLEVKYAVYDTTSGEFMTEEYNAEELEDIIHEVGSRNIIVYKRIEIDVEIKVNFNEEHG